MARRIVTVFGGSGFIGRHLVKKLADQGAIVRVAVRDPEGALFLKPLGDIGQIVPFPANVSDPASVARAVEGADTVVNLVGILWEWGKSNFQKVQAEGPANVAKAAAAAGCRALVHVSAIGADASSDSKYAQTKAAGEKAVLEAFPTATILRPSVVFGQEDGFFNKFAALAKAIHILPVFGCPLIPKVKLLPEGGVVDIDFYGDGGTKFQPVFVGDVAEAIIKAADDPKAQGKTYELGGPKVYSFKEIMDIVVRESGNKAVIVPAPFALASFKAFFVQMLPNPMITCDQVKLLKSDNVVTEGALTLNDLGIEPHTAEAIVPTYLHRFRPPTGHQPRLA